MPSLKEQLIKVSRILKAMLILKRITFKVDAQIQSRKAC